MKKIILIFSVVCSLLVSTVVLAVGPLDIANKNLGSALGSTGLSSDIAVSVGTVVKGVLAVVGTVFLVLTVYAGIIWMTAQGNETKVTKAKDTIVAAVIGLFIVMAAYAITAFVTSKVGGPGSSGCAGTCMPGSCSGLTPNVDSSGSCSNSGDVCCKA